MTNTPERAFGVVTEPSVIRFERILPGPIERVWSYLVEPEKRARWLAGGPMELRVGGAVELRFNHASLSAEPAPPPEKYKDMESGVSVPGRITRCEPPRVLAYTWAEEESDSEVTFELSETPDGVRLVLTHRRIPESEMSQVAAGWHAHLGVLEQDARSEDREAFWPAWSAWERVYIERLASPK